MIEEDDPQRERSVTRSMAEKLIRVVSPGVRIQRFDTPAPPVAVETP